MSALQQRTTPMLSKLDNNIENLLQKLQDILELSVINTESKSLETQAIETLQIESNTWTIIRLVDELLSVTRNLKENWILGHVPVSDDDTITPKETTTTATITPTTGNTEETEKHTDAGDKEKISIDEEEKYEIELKLKINQLLQDITGPVSDNIATGTLIQRASIVGGASAGAMVDADNDAVFLSD